jgi:hypothetical protein
MQNVSLEIRTIRMLPNRVPGNPDHAVFVRQEEYLRRKAYQNTVLTVTESFFDDSDMLSEYFLTLVFDCVSQTPLLSSRYYFDKVLIEKYLKGDHKKNFEFLYGGGRFELNDKLFLADRLSGNFKNELYRKHRSEIFSLYYTAIVRDNPNCSLVLMVRKDNGDKQLKKYLDLGFNLLGSTWHKGKEHSIIIAETSKWKQ